jgi:hypothetical protein
MIASHGGGQSQQLQEIAVNFDERAEGDYRIYYAGALEAPQGDGYIATVVVSRVRGVDNTPCEAFRDEKLACGHRWPTPEAALLYAVAKGRKLVVTEPHRLVC